MKETNMLLIAHRGNINGPNPDRENHPEYLQEALEAGYDIEVDVRNVDGKLYLGHDYAKYEATKYFQPGGYFANMHVWVHLKNLEAINFNYNSHIFFHDNDNFVLTNTGYVWTYPRVLDITGKSIAVLPELVPNWNVNNAYGICSDFCKNI